MRNSSVASATTGSANSLQEDTNSFVEL